MLENWICFKFFVIIFVVKLALCFRYVFNNIHNNYSRPLPALVIMISSFLDSSSSAFCSLFVKLLGLLVFKTFASLISCCTKSVKVSIERWFCEGVHGFCFSGMNIAFSSFLVVLSVSSKYFSVSLKCLSSFYLRVYTCL